LLQVYNPRSIEFADLSGHARDLARIARKFNSRAHNEFVTYTPLKALLHALTLARRFVHFTSFGLSPFMLGILTSVAQRANVDGVVSIISSGAASTITLAKNYNESIGSRLELRALGGEHSNLRLPHQKLVVIDGLIAFKGSANFTDYAWNNALEGLELIEVVTDVHEVTRLNVSVQSPVKQMQVIEPAKVETFPTGEPYRPRPGNSGDDALAVDN
jgi:phosphatidylserine/phosphatidylglycerophosphate/cardiolipin synthase-like enzyme